MVDQQDGDMLMGKVLALNVLLVNGGIYSDHIH